MISECEFVIELSLRSLHLKNVYATSVDEVVDNETTYTLGVTIPVTVVDDLAKVFEAIFRKDIIYTMRRR